ncbi:MAG: hypothetical protein JSV18_06015, partial [Candidatus Bathyarchaeota archaeon]
KIQATIHNAKEFQRIAEEHGSFQSWLNSLDKSENYAGVERQLSDRLKHVGRSTAHIFLYTVGEDIRYNQSVVGHHRRRA